MLPNSPTTLYMQIWIYTHVFYMHLCDKFFLEKKCLVWLKIYTSIYSAQMLT